MPLSNQPWCPAETSTENGVQEDLPTSSKISVCSLFGPVIEGTEITTVAQANEAHHRINGLFLDALGLGRFLVEQKEKVGHSNWEQWVKDKLEFTSRTASRYMLLYNERNQFATEQTRQTLSDLSMTKALKILSSNKRREKTRVATKKENATIVAIQQTEDSKKVSEDSKKAYLSGAYISRTSYEQFRTAIALLRVLDAKDYRYSQWIKILTGLIGEMKSNLRVHRSRRKTPSPRGWRKARDPIRTESVSAATSAQVSRFPRANQ
jgi:hypothetical protein